jgi:uncharacterized protein YeeX (DUF496 family)
MVYKIKIILNEKEKIIDEELPGHFTLELFNQLSGYAKELILNDNGGKFKAKLKKFDISKDKTFGHDWHFEINDNSKYLLLDTLKEYIKKQWGHFRYSLIGDDFKIDFEDVSDELVYPEYRKEKICSLFKIKAKGESLILIEKIFRINKNGT